MSNRLEVGAGNTLGLGKQAGGLGRGLGAQEDGHGQKNHDRGQNPERSAGASVHWGRQAYRITPGEPG